MRPDILDLIMQIFKMLINHLRMVFHSVLEKIIKYFLDHIITFNTYSVYGV